MSTAARADRITVRAKLRALNLFKHVHEVYLIILEISWLDAGSKGEEEKAEESGGEIQSNRPQVNIYRKSESRHITH